jgi:hypothetical protein
MRHSYQLHHQWKQSGGATEIDCCWIADLLKYGARFKARRPPV